MKVFVTSIMECRIFLKQAVLTAKSAMVNLGDGLARVLAGFGEGRPRIQNG
jgi:hypothetical protein